LGDVIPLDHHLPPVGIVIAVHAGALIPLGLLSGVIIFPSPVLMMY
jgi:hypothetical protein